MILLLKYKFQKNALVVEIIKRIIFSNLYLKRFVTSCKNEPILTEACSNAKEKS